MPVAAVGRVTNVEPLAEDAERMVLSAMMRASGEIEAVTGLLASTSFDTLRHQIIYAHITAAWAAGKPTDPVALMHQLVETGEIQRIGGAPYLADVYALDPAPAQAGYYAGLVADAAVRRALRVEASRLAQAAEVADPDRRSLLVAELRGRLAGESARGWGKPTSVDEIDRTPLPAAAGRYPEALWAFVDAVAVGLQVPRDMVLLQVLSVLSTATGGRWVARILPDWVEPLGLYTVSSMLSGSRKSATVKAATLPLFEVERELVEKVAPVALEQQTLRDIRVADAERLKRDGARGKCTEADVIAAVQAVDEIDVPVVPRLIADDITPERLAILMSEQGGRLGVHSAEGGLFAILAGRYSSGQPNLDLVLKAHAGDPVRVDRVGRGPLMLDEPFLAVGVTVQPDVLEGLAESRLFRGAGLLARFLYALPETLLGRRDLDPAAIPDEISRDYGQRVKALATMARKRTAVTEVKLTPSAGAILRELREQIESRLDPHSGDLAEIVDWASKLPGQAVRIAAVLTLFADPSATEVDEAAMGEAASLTPYLVGQALAAFDVINGRQARAARPRAVLAWIRRKRLDEFTVRQARRDLGGQAWASDVENVREVLDDLEDLGWIRRRPDSERRVGRPTERYEVNPYAHARPGSVNSVNASGGAA